MRLAPPRPPPSTLPFTTPPRPLPPPPTPPGGVRATVGDRGDLVFGLATGARRRKHVGTRERAREAVVSGRWPGEGPGGLRKVGTGEPGGRALSLLLSASLF